MSVRAAGNTFLAAGLELLASNDDSSQGGGEVEGRTAPAPIKRRKCNVWCLGLRSTMFQGSHCCSFCGSRNLLPGCLSVSFACQTESSRVESTCINHTSPRQKSIATILPSTGVGDLWRSATGFNTVQTCTMGLPWQRATKACPKLLVSSWPWACGQKTLDFSNNNGHTCTLSS